MMTFFLNYLSYMIPILVNVALVTLLERKVLALIQLRKGPNKTLMEGLGQPFGDVMKLFLKEVFHPFKSNSGMYKVAPVLMAFVMLLLWMMVSVKGTSLSMQFSSLLFLMVLSVSVYPLMISGWSSNSKYAMLGALRGVCQTISYELSLALIFFNILMMVFSPSLSKFYLLNSFLSMLLIAPSLLFFWVLSAVAETNRTPFDFAEGESELVSGFNVEYSAGGFTLIFLAEYGMIIFFSYFSSFIMLPHTSKLSVIVLMSVMIFFWVWLRGTLPRYRYDKLMGLAWKTILPLVLMATPFYVYLLVSSF